MIRCGLVVLLLLYNFQQGDADDEEEDDSWYGSIEPEWTPCISALLMPYDSDKKANSYCKESNLPDFPLCGFKQVQQEKKSHLETAINLTELINVMQDDVYESDNKQTLDESCRNDKKCLGDLIFNYGARHPAQDLNADKKTNCDDLAILLYVYHNVSSPTTIECTTFWKLFRRNIAFLKHSQSIDVNAYDLKNGNVNIGEKQITAKIKKTDNDFFICKNGQCGSLYEGGFITACDGALQCVDLSDEQNCESCQGSSIECLVYGVPTCLPSNNFCKYNPTTCKHKNNTSISLKNCTGKSFQEKFEDCKIFLDKTYREIYGEEKYTDEDETEIRKPRRPYRDRLCRINDKNIFEQNETLIWTLSDWIWARFGLGLESKNKTIVIDEDLPDNFLAGSYHEFRYININQSLCQDQVDQRLGACKDSCPEPGEFGDIEFWKCNNGRCIDTYNVCNGNQDCKNGEDESLQSCAGYGRKYDEEEDFQNCQFNAFPCPISGKCIAKSLVCNGITDCPDGEDENFQLWGRGQENVGELDLPYVDQVTNWSFSNPDTYCNQLEPCSLDPIASLMIIFVLVVCILAMTLEPLEVKNSFLLRAKRSIKSRFGTEAKSVVLIERGPASKETIATVDYLLIRNEFENKENVKASNQVKKDLADQILESENMDKEKALTKLKLMDTHHTSQLKDHILQSFSLKIKNTLYDKTFKTQEIPETLMILYKLGQSALPLYIVGAIALEYYFDFSLATAWYSAFNGTNTTGFSFAPYFLGIFVFTCVTLAVSYLAMVFIGSYTTYFQTEKPHQKVFYTIALIFTPIFFPLSKFMFTLKKVWQPAATFEEYLDKETISLQYEIVLNQMAVVKTLLENMPQLYVAFLLSLSTPLYEKIEKYEYKIIVFLFVFVKPIFTLIAKSWQIATLHRNLRDRKVGMLGNVLICLSSFFCTMSRIFAITFCIIFSSCFPDIPFYLYWLSNAAVWQDEVTPFVRETLYQTDISYAPAVFVIILLVAYPIIYYQVTKHYMLVHTHNKASPVVQLILAITNVFCPLKPKLDFTREINDHHNVIINGAIFFSFFINNILFLVFPFLWYGTSLFTTTLPVLDELIRFFRFKNSFGNFPLSFPTEIPTTVLNAHIIFPVSSCLCFLIGCLLFIIYQTKFHIWAPLKPTQVMEYEKESPIELEEKINSGAGQQDDESEVQESSSDQKSVDTKLHDRKDSEPGENYDGLGQGDDDNKQ